MARNGAGASKVVNFDFHPHARLTGVQQTIEDIKDRIRRLGELGPLHEDWWNQITALENNAFYLDACVITMLKEKEKETFQKSQEAVNAG